MKKIVSMVLMVAMAVTLTACGTKDSKTGAEKDKVSSGSEDSNTEQEVLYVGTEAGFLPYEYMEGNEIVGVDMDIAQAIADAMGKKLEIVNMEFDAALVAVQTGKVDLVAAGVSVDEERKKNMDFSVDYIDNKDVVIVNKENPMVSSIDDLDGKIIGVQQGNIADIWCSDEENIKAKEVKRYPKFAQAAEDLANGKIDCVVMDKYPAEEIVKVNKKLTILDGVLFEDKYAIAVKKGNTELLEQINTVIEDLKANGKIEEFVANHAQAK